MPLVSLLLTLNCEELLTVEEHEALQKDLDRLEHWVVINGMKLAKPRAGFCPGME